MNALNISIWPTLPDMTVSDAMMEQINRWNEEEEPLFGSFSDDDGYNYFRDEAYDICRDDALEA